MRATLTAALYFIFDLDLILFLGVIITIVSILLLKFFSKENKYTNLIKFFPIMLSSIHFIIGKFNYLVVPVYIASMIIIFIYLYNILLY